MLRVTWQNEQITNKRREFSETNTHVTLGIVNLHVTVTRTPYRQVSAVQRHNRENAFKIGSEVCVLSK
jgi:hypothetical protein